MALTSSNEPRDPLLTGHVRAYRDNAAGQIVIETTKENPAGSGLEICRMKDKRTADARAMLAFAGVFRAAQPFAALGKALDLSNADPEAPLLSNAGMDMVITVGDVQAIMAACANVYPPQIEIPPGARLKRPKPPPR